MYLSLACSLHILRVTNVSGRRGESEKKGKERGEKSSTLGTEKWSIAEANSVFSADLYSGLGWDLGELARGIDGGLAVA